MYSEQILKQLGLIHNALGVQELKLKPGDKVIALMIGFIMAWLALSILFTDLYRDLSADARTILFFIFILSSSASLAVGFGAEESEK